MSKNGYIFLLINIRNLTNGNTRAIKIFMQEIIHFLKRPFSFSLRMRHEKTSLLRSTTYERMKSKRIFTTRRSARVNKKEIYFVLTIATHRYRWQRTLNNYKGMYISRLLYRIWHGRIFMCLGSLIFLLSHCSAVFNKFI